MILIGLRELIDAYLDEIRIKREQEEIARRIEGASAPGLQAEKPGKNKQKKLEQDIKE